MASNRQRTQFLTALVLLSGPAMAAEDALSDHLLRQLSCAAAPSAMPSLVALERGGRFDVMAGERRDNTTCWRLKPSLDLEGMTFDHVCASSEDPLLIELFPDYFFRGPGTSAGETLALTTTRPLAALESWAAAHLGGGEPRYAVSQGSQVESEADVGCTGIPPSPPF